jgi:5-methylcytosine-specific restriction endonuclease McrA
MEFALPGSGGFYFVAGFSFIMEYIERLKDQRWKNKCKKILTRDGYRCTSCGSKKKLQVHHTFYYDNYPNPWEYPNKSLITVCEKCHREYHEFHEIEIRESRLNQKKRKTKLKKRKIKRLSLAQLQSKNPIYLPRKNV